MTPQYKIWLQYRGLIKEVNVYTCEDYPCCGHEAGDCDGSKYGSDEDIKQAVYDRLEDDYDEPEGWY